MDNTEHINLTPIKLTTENSDSAIASMLLHVMSRLRIIEYRLGKIERGETALSADEYEEMRKGAHETYRVDILAKFGA
jgi:hypothetical protein